MINKVLIGNVHSLDDNEQHKNLLSKEDFIVPKNKFQDAIFTIIMATLLVYGIVVYNVALNIGEVSSKTFLLALKELPIMVPIAFVLEFFYSRKVS